MYRHLAFLPVSFLSRFILLFSFTILSACGGSSGGTETDNNKNDEDKITPTPKAAQALSFAEQGELVKVINVDEPTFSNTLSGVKSTGSLTYTSSEESVATVNPEGVITLITEGETTISAHSAADEHYLAATTSFRLIVEKDKRLSAPQLSVQPVIKRIKLLWSQVENAHHYHLFRCDPDCKKLALDLRAEFNLETIDVVRHIDADDNTASHTYRVQACDENETICSELSAPVRVLASETTAHFKAPTEYLSEDALFGEAVAISANYELAISAPGEVIDETQNIKGAVYIYDRYDGQWQLRARFTNPVPNSEFGSSLDMHFLTGQLVVSGSSTNSEGFIRLMAHVYDCREGVWSHDTTLTLDTQGTIAGHHSNVAISDTDTVVLSNGWGNGSAALFQRSAGSWHQQWVQQGGAEPDALTYTNIAISSSDNTFAIASEDDEQLRVNIYRRNDQDLWQHEYEIIRNVSSQNHSKIDLVDGGLLAVGVTSESRIQGETAIKNVGAIHLYRHTAQEWAQIATLQPKLPADTRFGYSLALSWEGEYLVAGADDPRLEKPIFMYYSDDQSNWVQIEGGNISTRKSSEGKYLDNYGKSLAVSPVGDSVLIGASADGDRVQESISSLKEKETIDQSEKSGAVYLF